jgi:hypothetical protein
MLTKIQQQTIKRCKIDKLYYLPFNRDVEKPHVNVMLNSLIRNGLTRLPVIVLTKMFSGSLRAYLLDGQHLVHSLKKAGETEVDCIVLERNTPDEMVQTIADMNTTSKSWSLFQFVRAFSAVQKPSYMFLYQQHVTYGFPLNALAEMYTSHDKTTLAIKSGNLLIDREKQGDIILRYYQDIGKFIGFNAHQIQGFTRFFRSLQHKKYNHNIMMECLVNKKAKGIKGLDIGKTVEVLSYIYGSLIEEKELAGIG